jgi:alpha-tubulin suppressor-like RCC1 family protein
MMFVIILIFILLTVLLLLHIYYKRECFENIKDPYIIDIGTGANHSVFLNKYGTPYVCGKNVDGRLGTGNSVSLTLTIPLTQFKNLVKKVYTGNVNTFFIMKEGDAVYATGENFQGQLGIGTLNNQFNPIRIPTFQSIPIQKVAAGWYHTIFLTTSGDVYVCGDNKYGQFGNGTTSSTPTPTPIKLDFKCIDIAAGQGHSVFLMNDGNVYTAGWNWQGQLGNGNESNSNTPFLINNLSGATSVYAGMTTTIVLTDSKVFVVGDNKQGQLGLSRNSREERIFVELKIEQIKFISCGHSHTLFMTAKGDVYATGLNNKGQLGIGNNTTIYIPQKITTIPEPILKIAAGSHHSTFVTQSGKVYATGDNNNGGQLGVNNKNITNSPLLSFIYIQESETANTFGCDVAEVGCVDSVKD